MGQDLVASGQADADIRIMWEQNGNWYPWGTQALSAGQFIADWDAIVAALRAVPGNNFSYTWDGNAGGSNEFATWRVRVLRDLPAGRDLGCHTFGDEFDRVEVWTRVPGLVLTEGQTHPSALLFRPPQTRGERRERR